MADTSLDHTPLVVTDLHVHYGAGHVLQGLSIDVPARMTTALVGRNGVGKTTLVHAIMGIVPVRRGTVRLASEDITALPSHERWSRGLVLVPQGRRLFSSLTVHEHLTLKPSQQPGRYDVDALYDLFPSLAERRSALAGTLSGGERSMLAIARALIANPQVLLMDEPTEGLAPRLVDRVAELTLQLAGDGLPILLVEQNLTFTLSVADRIGIVDRGVVQELQSRDELADVNELSKRTLATPDNPDGAGRNNS